MSIRGLFCEDCGIRVTAISVEGSPHLVHHDYRKKGAARCRKTWLVEPDSINETVRTRVILGGRKNEDVALAEAMQRFTEKRNKEQAEAAAQAVFEFFEAGDKPAEGLRMGTA